MRKFLAILLAVLMVVPAFAFTTSAEEATTPDKIDFVPFVMTTDLVDLTAEEMANMKLWHRGDKTFCPRWDTVGGDFTTLTYDLLQEGVGFTFNGKLAKGRGISITTDYTDLSGMTVVCFDLYLSDADAVNAESAIWRMELGENNSFSPKRGTGNTTLQELFGGKLQDGWNHFEVPLKAFTAKDKTWTDALLANISSIRLYTNSADFGSSDANTATTIMLKNVYFAKDEITYKNTWWSTPGTHPDGTATTNADKMNNTSPKQELAEGDAMAAGTVQFRSTFTALDLSAWKNDGTGKLVFDFYVSDVDALNADTGNWKMEIYHSSKNTDTNYVIFRNGTLKALHGGKDLVVGWNRMEIPFSTFTGANLASYDWSKFTCFKFYNNHAMTATGDDTTDDAETITFQMRNFRIVKELGAVEVIPTVTGYEGTALEQFKTVENGTVPVAGDIKFHVNHDTVKPTTAGVDALSFDLYISDIEALNTATSNWKLEVMTSNNNTIWRNATLPALKGSALVEGWNHFEVPFSTLTGTTGTFNNNWVVRYRLFNNNTDAITDDNGDGVVTFAMKNPRYVKAGYDDSVTMKAVPTLTNSFNVAVNVTNTGDAIISDPYIDVMVDGYFVRGAAVNSYSCDFDGILAHRLSDTFTVRVTTLDKNGAPVAKTLDYSIKDYAKNMMGNNGATLDRLLSDMLHYGDAAQNLINYNLDNLATAGVAGVLEATALDTAALEPLKTKTLRNGTYTEGAKWKSATLVLDSAMYIRYTFEAESIEGLVVNVDNYDGELEIFADDKIEGRYHVYVPVNAGQFAEDFTAHFNDNTEYAVTYSVDAYIARNYGKYLDNPETEIDEGATILDETATYDEMYDLLTAIYNYGKSAKAYIDAQ